MWVVVGVGDNGSVWVFGCALCACVREMTHKCLHRKAAGRPWSRRDRIYHHTHSHSGMLVHPKNYPHVVSHHVLCICVYVCCREQIG